MRVAFLAIAMSLTSAATLVSAEFTGIVVDAHTQEPIAARIYIRNEVGQWLFVKSKSAAGSAIPYAEQWVPMPASVERHTTVSAHPFGVELGAGRYRITVERGKEYASLSKTIVVQQQSSSLEERFALRRWVNMSARGWYSGETHVHRRIPELANVMLAEDLNVAFPVTFWTTDAYQAPHLEPSVLRRQGPSPFGRREDRGYAPLQIDDKHVIYPRNSEFEVFSVDGQSHVLGAMFILNHKSVFAGGVPPVGQIAAQAHREGALIDLDKHNWPWSMMLVPIAQVDLFELSNNSVWRTTFGFRQTTVPWAEYMQVEVDDEGMTELGWLNFGFQNYYALLNCGFALKPTAGTASGVHPVPLGYSRVYVHLDREFSGDRWINGLRQGRSFVTNGPMLLATVNQHHPGHRFAISSSRTFDVAATIVSEHPLERVELVVNGQISPLSLPTSRQAPHGGFHYTFQQALDVTESSWLAVRCFEKNMKGRVRFAHTGPWHVQLNAAPVQPRREEVEYLMQRIRREIERNRGVLPAQALAEFEQALHVYEQIARRAR